MDHMDHLNKFIINSFNSSQKSFSLYPIHVRELIDGDEH